MKTEITEILENFSYLDEWEDRYKYVIELGRELDECPDSLKVDANKVRGCVSQVWLDVNCEKDDEGVARLTFIGDSDALIVRGLVRIMFALYNGKSAREILDTDVESTLDKIGLRNHLTPQRSNGLTAMVARIRSDAQKFLN